MREFFTLPTTKSGRTQDNESIAVELKSTTTGAATFSVKPTTFILESADFSIPVPE